jgi:hypothetical protein
VYVTDSFIPNCMHACACAIPTHACMQYENGGLDLDTQSRDTRPGHQRHRPNDVKKMEARIGLRSIELSRRKY